MVELGLVVLGAGDGGAFIPTKDEPCGYENCNIMKSDRTTSGSYRPGRYNNFHYLISKHLISLELAKTAHYISVCTLAQLTFFFPDLRVVVGVTGVAICTKTLGKATSYFLSPLIPIKNRDS